MAKKETKELAQPAQPTMTPAKEMSLEEARAHRAALYVPAEITLSEEEKREKFKLFWAQNRKKYGNPKELENILWLHLKATGNIEPEKFDSGILHFGLKRIGK